MLGRLETVKSYLVNVCNEDQTGTVLVNEVGECRSNTSFTCMLFALRLAILHTVFTALRPELHNKLSNQERMALLRLERSRNVFCTYFAVAFVICVNLTY